MNKEIEAVLKDERRLEGMANVFFDEVDRDGSGFIDQGELHGAMVKFSKTMRIPPPTAEEVQAKYESLDADMDGQVSRREFLELIRTTLRKLINWKPDQVDADTEEDQRKREGRKAEAARFRGYVESSGLRKAFQIIFAEVVTKRVEPEHVFAYSAMRLRQLGVELAPLLPEELRGAKAEIA